MSSIGFGGGRAAQGIGDFAAPGNAGSHGTANYYDQSEAASGQSINFGGIGGAAAYGGATQGPVQAPSGSPGLPGMFGSGGSGAGSGGQNNTGQIGGVGGDGVCIVTEFILGDQ